MNGDDPFWMRALNWVWTNWETVEQRLKRLYHWFRGVRSDSPVGPGILVIGPGGTGKTTLGRFLAGEMVLPLLSEPWEYRESIARETFALADDSNVELEIFPGQQRHRPAIWESVRSEIAGGNYRGIILTSAYGYHSFWQISYKQHVLFQGSKERFLVDFLAAGRKEELRVFEYLRPALESISGRLWILVVVTKEDLWWPDRANVRNHYEGTDGPWQAILDAVRVANKNLELRTIVAYLSLVINNLTTAEGETLIKNAEGYDQRLQVNSQRHLLEVLDGLREWENP
jgi:hypothetical protein